MCSVLFECAAPCSITRITDHPTCDGTDPYYHIITFRGNFCEINGTVPVLYRYCVPCVPCVSRLPPVSFYRYCVQYRYGTVHNQKSSGA